MHGLYVIILVFALNIFAIPVQPFSRELLDARDDNNQFISPKAWIPIAVIVLLLCLAVLIVWSKDYWRKAVTVFGGAYGTAHVGVPSTGSPIDAGREFTAEQLVGPDLPISGGARHARRTRRPRRTPSQVSVTSLPAYNKEPGEEELVIFRGRDMEDVTMPVVSPVDEDDSLNSQEDSQVSRYPPMPTSHNNVPLLHNDNPSSDLSLQRVRLRGANGRRASLDSSLEETSSLMVAESNSPEGSSDPRGDAPPYFEVVDNNNNTLESDSGVPTTQTSSPTSPTRRSGFRTFLNRMSMMSQDSHQSVSTSNVHGRERSTSIRTSNHRASGSNQTHGSSAGLNSPSLISLNLISSPLPHTLIRTEFTYPKSGPTPEQLKVISSRENFSRFGMPYGPDAVAFAASSSRQDLEPPPPDFEASSSQPSLLRPGPSRLDSSDNVIGEGEEHGGGTRSSQPDTRSENVNTSTPSITRTDHESSTSLSTSEVPNRNSSTQPSSASSRTRIVPLPLPPINVSSDLGRFSTSPTSLSPQHASNRDSRASHYSIRSTSPNSLAPRQASARESRGSNYSFQSYATAAEILRPGVY